MKDKNIMIVVVGPTASGKSELAVKLAKKHNGEIISADSRQIYKGLDIGSGKVPGKWTKVKSEGKSREVFVYKNITHYLIDEANPRTQYSVAKFQKKARAIIADILKGGKTPIICGGTGHWVDAVVYDLNLPDAKPDAKLRAKLEKLSTAQLFAKLQKLDPARAKNIDAKNPRRLVRALEIVIGTGQPVPQASQNKPFFKDIKVQWIGLNPTMEVLEKKIKKRLKSRIKEGLLKEVKNLHSPKKGTGLSWKKLEAFGLEYKFCALHLQGKLTIDEMESLLFTAIRQYAKRQMTWWKRNLEIKWFADNKKAL